MYHLIYFDHADKDALKIKRAGLKERAEFLLDIISRNPYQNPPPYEKLIGDCAGMYSRRINIKHRLVYEVDKTNREVRILRMWGHYE